MDFCHFIGMFQTSCYIFTRIFPFLSLCGLVRKVCKVLLLINFFPGSFFLSLFFRLINRSTFVLSDFLNGRVPTRAMLHFMSMSPVMIKRTDQSSRVEEAPCFKIHYSSGETNSAQNCCSGV